MLPESSNTDLTPFAQYLAGEVKSVEKYRKQLILKIGWKI